MMTSLLIPLVSLLCLFPAVEKETFDFGPAAGTPDFSWVKEVGAKKFPRSKKNIVANDYGAISDTSQLSTVAIQKAIDACAQAGGGTVTFRAGAYKTGALFLKSGVNLIIDKKVTLYASTDFSDYPLISTRIAGIEMEWPAAFINAIDVENAALSGEGTLDGQGSFCWDKYWAMRAEYEPQGLRWIVDYDCQRVRGILVSNSQHVTLQDFTLERTGFWGIQILYSTHCTVQRVDVCNNIGGHGPSTDGVDIDSSQYILVEGCDIDCNDDNFCLKAGRDADGLRVNRPTCYVVIRDCIARKGSGLLTCGSETSGGIYNVLAYDMKAYGTSAAMRLKSALNRGGYVNRIYMTRVEVQDVRTVLEADLNWNPSYSYSTLPEAFNGKPLPPHWTKMLTPVEPVEKGYPHFSDVYFSHVKAVNAGTFISASGWNESLLLENFYLYAIQAQAQTAGKMVYVKGFHLDDVALTVADNSTIKRDDRLSYALYEPYLAGVFQLGYESAGRTAWLTEKEAYVKVSKWPLSQSRGFVMAVTAADNLPEDFALYWAYGACYGQVLDPLQEASLLPAYCFKNVFVVEPHAIVSYSGESPFLHAWRLTAPPQSEIRVSDANQGATPAQLFASGKKTQAPVLAARCPMKAGQTLYFCLFTQNAQADYSYSMLPALFNTEKPK